MKYIKKNRLSEKYRLLIIFGSALLVLIAAAILLGIFLYNDGGEEGPEVDPPEILEGEALKTIWQ